MQKMNKHMQECIENCNDCRDECEKMLFQHCLEMGGEHLEQAHVKIMADCIEICQTAANFMLRGSDMHGDVCHACADICDACADSCDEIGGKEMERCADVCRACAESCREMGQMMGMHGPRQSGRSTGIMA
jgi:hypothetical protein